MTTAFVALGSNLAGALEAPQAQINAALAALDNLAFSRLRRVSSFYSTPAWGDDDVADDEKPRYVNAVAEMHTDLAADAFLRALQDIETAQGRVRDPKRPNGPRTLDLDLLLYGRIRLKTIELTCPHPRMHDRAFVLQPLLEIAPDVQIPGLGKAETYFAALPPSDIFKLDSPHGIYQP